MMEQKDFIAVKFHNRNTYDPQITGPLPGNTFWMPVYRAYWKWGRGSRRKRRSASRIYYQRVKYPRYSLL